MEVRNALTHAVINRNEGSFSAHSALDGSRQNLNIVEQRLNEVRRQVGESLKMCPRHEKAMAGEDGPAVKKGDRIGVFKDYMTLFLSAYDLTKHASAMRSVFFDHGAPLQTEFSFELTCQHF